MSNPKDPTCPKSFFEAKIRAMVHARREIFEKAYDCKLPVETEEQEVKEEMEHMKPLLAMLAQGEK